MRTKPPNDQNQLRHTATEAQKQHINGEAREAYDFSPQRLTGNYVDIHSFIFLHISSNRSTAIMPDGGFAGKSSRKQLGVINIFFFAIHSPLAKRASSQRFVWYMLLVLAWI